MKGGSMTVFELYNLLFLDPDPTEKEIKKVFNLEYAITCQLLRQMRGSRLRRRKEQRGENGRRVYVYRLTNGGRKRLNWYKEHRDLAPRLRELPMSVWL